MATGDAGWVVMMLWGPLHIPSVSSVKEKTQPSVETKNGAWEMVKME